MAKSKVEKYSLSLRVLHWLMSALVVIMISVGFYMMSLDDSVPYKFSLFNLHESTGVIVLLLAISRLIAKFKTTNPELPSHLPMVEKRAAQSVHFLLYGLLFMIPMSGMLMTMLSGYKVPFFLIELPNFLPENKEMGKFFANAHGILAYGIITLAVIHIAGIAKEYFFNKKNLLKRMF